MAIYDTAIAEKLKVPWLLVGVCGIWAVFSIVAGRLGMLARPGFWLPVFILAAAVAVLASRWNNFWLEWVGQKSYSVYLFHFAVVELVGALFGDFARSGPLGFLMALFISISGALAVGSFSARYLEASSGRLGLNLLNRLSRGSEK